MNFADLEYKIKTASCDEIIAHLTKCAADFIPPLNTYVDISAYGAKIFTNAITFECWNRSELVGLIATYYNNYKDKMGFITNVSIIQEYHGYGIISKLLKEAIDYGEKNGFISIALEVNQDNEKAIRVYEKYGFFRVDQLTDKIQMKRTLHPE